MAQTPPATPPQGYAPPPQGYAPPPQGYAPPPQVVAPPLQVVVPVTGQWQHGLFGCFDNTGLCIITFLFPCYTFGKNAEAVGESCLLCGIGACILWPLQPIDAILYTAIRGKIRNLRGIHGSAVGDFFSTCCCTQCALVQEAQEIQAGLPVHYMARE